MGFSRSHNDELKSLERGRAGADMPMSIRDFDVSLSIQDNSLCQFWTTKSDLDIKIKIKSSLPRAQALLICPAQKRL